MNVLLPPVVGIEERANGNIIQQYLQSGFHLNANIQDFKAGDLEGYLLIPSDTAPDPILVISSGNGIPEEYTHVLRIAKNKQREITGYPLDLSQSRWIRHPFLSKDSTKTINYSSRIKKVITSWRNAFSFVEEDPSINAKGLRAPQIGAVHAVHAHWVVSLQAATVIMPTGTGKTETMLSVLVSNRCSRLLVVVPTDALRVQIANKFLSLGLLKEIGAVDKKALYPIVGILKHKPRNIDEVDSFFEKCNVVVTTMQIAGQCTEEVQERFAYHCPFLFIDEAHHIAAKTWKNFKQKFRSGKILQFTATPYRNDGQLVDGKPIFNFPLKKAQEQDYFKRINFTPVFEYDPKNYDKVIATKAVEQLREDCRKGYDHILMARVDSLERAEEVFRIYEQYSEFNPVQIHTGIKSQVVRDEIRRKINNKESRIVICVDMLGEGFDLPELKIAALHDIRKSLPVTLQLIGRFIRGRTDLGEPTFIANAGDTKNVDGELNRLYAQDADWNVLLPQSSEKATQEQIDILEFNDGFRDFPEEIPIQNIHPAMSTVVYKTNCDEWTPEKCMSGIDGAESLDLKRFSINYYKNTLIIITAKRIAIDWVNLKEMYNWNWELNIVYWDQEQQLLFINSSGNSGYYQKLAEAVVGNVELIKGGDVFRCLSGVNRLKLQNVGLIEEFGRLIRYIMSAGSDVERGMSEAQKRKAKKANIFGVGFEDGEKTSIGCSYKGRIWSRKITHILGLTEWCSQVGKKVLDKTIDPDEILRGTLISEEVSNRPNKMPVCIEWPEIMYLDSEAVYEVFIDGKYSFPLHELDIRLKDPSEDGPILFEIGSDEVGVEMELTLFERNERKDYQYSLVGKHDVTIKRRNTEFRIEEFFYKESPKVWFADGSSLEGNSFTPLQHLYPPYPPEKIYTLDWTGIDLRKESQGIMQEADSIQYRMIQELQSRSYDVIFDDDGSGEAADIVTVQENSNSIVVEFYHCKFSKEKLPGGRIDDLYAVCGQAQKSIHWREKPEDLFNHLQRREPKRKLGNSAGRFIRGNREILQKLQIKLRLFPVDFKIYIVQPGISKAKVTEGQLELLSVTENYLMETYKLPFGVIASE